MNLNYQKLEEEAQAAFDSAEAKVGAAKLAELRDRLARLELVPKNESCRFKLETEIYRFEREIDTDSTDEWAGFDLLEA